MSATPHATSESLLPAGRFTVEPAHSKINFAVKGMWGLVTVRGRFREFSGTLQLGEGSAYGELVIEAATLDSGQTMRDKHLRSPDFFDVERHPRLRFCTSSVTNDAGALTVSGDLIVGATKLKLQIPIELERRDDGGLLLRGSCSVAPTAVGITWNKLGAIRGDAKLQVALVLKPEDQ